MNRQTDRHRDEIHRKMRQTKRWIGTEMRQNERWIDGRTGDSQIRHTNERTERLTGIETDKRVIVAL